MASDAYEVGYGKPPLHTRFTKGSSGNPRGRPKKTATASALITAALREKITVNEGGRARRLSKAEVIARQLANKAASGDPRFIKLSFELLQQAEVQEALRAEGRHSASEMAEQDRLLLGRIMDGMRLEERDDEDA